jgi:iron complex transport system ATP-binding protein
MKMETTYLSTTDLSVGYSQGGTVTRLFNNLNLILPAGKMFCFMGPNGAGKSSLLRTLAGLQRPLAGAITLHPRDDDKTATSQIAVVLTDRISAVNLTVEEIVTFGRYPYLGWNVALSDTDKKKIAEAIELVHLQSLLHKRLYELSDGQLQMVMIARALAQDTPIMLLDEPTAHLDLNNRVEAMDLLRSLTRQTGKAILLATHELDLALQTADLIWLTGKRENIITGFPEDLVLNGCFDETFELKGFDLRTGRVKHHAFRKLSVGLTGEGPEYLWTKNALERNGYAVSPGPHDISVTVTQRESQWVWLTKTDADESEVDSIKSLVELLEQTIAGKHP